MSGPGSERGGSAAGGAGIPGAEPPAGPEPPGKRAPRGVSALLPGLTWRAWLGIAAALVLLLVLLLVLKVAGCVPPVGPAREQREGP